MSEIEQIIRFRVLGPLRVHTEAGELAIGAVRERTLLGMLLLHAGGTVTVQRLVDAVWDEEPPQNARNQLQGCVSRLRKQLATAGIDRQIIATTTQGYQLDVETESVDLFRFRRLRDEARDAAAGGDHEGASEQYRSALGLWRGTVLEDLESRAVHRVAAALEEERAQAVEERVELELAVGGAGGLVVELTSLVEQYPYREALHGALMRALYRAGRQAEALAAYQRVRERLRDELGAEPGSTLQQLHQAILRNDADLSRQPSRPEPAIGGRLIPRQLPANVAGFAGRADALAQLDKLLPDGAPSAPAPVVISAIAGTAGVGKTALAIHWAHQVAGRFPDGQLYVNLRGFDPTRPPVEPAEAIRGFLDAMQVPPQRIPVSQDAQAGLYRSLLADRRMLVVLDNARNATQVRTLLPGSPGCMVVITSRTQLLSLIATDGARPLTLGLLTQAEAHQLLERRLGIERLALEPDATEEIIARCARLPLALAIVAAQAASFPELPLADLAHELQHVRSHLDALSDSDPAVDVRTVFGISYRALTPDAARLFRQLSLHPGPDISTFAAASLADVSVRRVRVLLAELIHAHLIGEHTRGRYGFHDLLRSYAAELADALDTDETRKTAVHRLFDFYLHTANTAAMLLNAHRVPIALPLSVSGVIAEVIEDQGSALAWLTRERRVLLAGLSYAASIGFDTHSWQLAWTLADFLHRQGHWFDAHAAQTTALCAARRLGDPFAEATVLRNLARACLDLGTYDDARAHLMRALDHFINLGDIAGQARTEFDTVFLLDQLGRHEDALAHAERALRLYRAERDDYGQAMASNGVGWEHAQLGNYEQAVDYCRHALGLQQKIGDRRGEGSTWDSLGYVYGHLGDRRRAIACHRRALDLVLGYGDRDAEARILIRLGDAHQAAGEPDEAAQVWRRALAILEELDHPHADRVRAKLHLVTVQP